MTLPASLFKFLKTIKANNNREWFQANKKTYVQHHEFMKQYVAQLQVELEKHDVIEKSKLYRIYRDVRFSKDKTPYKSHFGGWFRRATKQRRGGYYFHIEPNNTMIAGGFWRPNSADLKRVRAELAANDEGLRTLLTSPTFIKTFGQLKGEKVKTAPRGYSTDHPAIDLLQHKQWVVKRSFRNKEVLNDTFFEEIIDTFLKMRPFFDYMSEVLTTDANGLPLD